MYSKLIIKRLSFEEVACENFFDATVKRIEGRYKVSLPLKEDPRVLGESRIIALKRVNALEKRLEKDKELRSSL